MKMIVAYVRHEAFEPIREDLLAMGFPSLSVSEVKGSGRQKGIVETYRGAQLTNHLRPKIKIEIVVEDADAQKVIDSILKNAQTGNVGDGKVFVIPVEQAFRVRTGESGDRILQAHEGDA
jgi:nitrogen regulatory protein PII